MGAIFQSISAEFSSDFEMYMSNEKARSFLERVCEITGTLLICNSDDDVHSSNSLKLCGSWDSISNAHNILSAYPVVNDLMKNEDLSEICFKSPSFKITQESSRRKRKTPCPRNIVLRPDISLPHQESEQIRIERMENPAELPESPVPVAITNLQNNQSEAIVFPRNSTESHKQLITSDGADMFFMKNEATQESPLAGMQEKPLIHVDGTKGPYSCSMCKYATNSARNLESHIDRFHLKPVTCHKCGKGFGYERDLKRHLLKNKYSCLGRYLVNRTAGPDSSSVELNQHEKNASVLKESDSELSSEFTNQSMAIKIKEEPIFDDENTTDYEINSSTGGPVDGSSTGKNFDLMQLKNEFSEEKESNGQQDDKLEFSDHQEMQNMYMESDSDAQNDFSNEFTTSSIPGDLLKFNCHSCPYVAQKKQHIIDHICRMHKKQYACSHCHSKFGLMKDLNRHLRRSHGVDIPLKNSRGMNMTF